MFNPDRHGLADDRTHRERPKIPPVQAVPDAGVHQENLAGDEPSAATPPRQWPAKMVAIESKTNSFAVDGDDIAHAADRPSGKSCNMLQQRHAARQKPASREEGRDTRRRHGGDQLTVMQGAQCV